MSAYTWVADEVITTTGTSSYQLTVPSSLGAIAKAVVQAASSTSGLRAFYTLDNNTPTSDLGKQLIAGSVSVVAGSATFFGNELEKLKFAGSAANVRLHVDYYA